MGKWIDNLVRKCIRLCFKIIKKDITDEQVEGFVQFVRFCIVGLSNTIVAYVIYLVVIFILDWFHAFESYNFVIANVVQFILSVLWSFFWNQRYVFQMKSRKKTDILKALLKTYMTYMFTGLILNNALSFLWVKVFNISVIIAPLFNLVLSIPINFLLNKFWAFKE